MSYMGCVEPMTDSRKDSLKTKTWRSKQNSWTTVCCFPHSAVLRGVMCHLQISWEDRHTNFQVLEEANITSITTTIMLHQLTRMSNTVLPKQILYFQEGRSASTRWAKETFQRQYQDQSTQHQKFHITLSNIALDRLSRKKSMQEGALCHEKESNVTHRRNNKATRWERKPQSASQTYEDPQQRGQSYSPWVTASDLYGRKIFTLHTFK